MAVMNLVRRMVGFTDVKERNGEIVLTGVSADSLARDMKHVWATSKVASAMFTKVSWGEIRIPSFFALELRFILEQLMNAKRLYTPKHKLRTLIDAIETNTWVANTMGRPTEWAKYEHLKEIIYPSLLPHQMDFLRSYEATVPRYGLNGMLLSAAAGGGKSISDCGVALITESTKVIVVCPKNAVYRVWEKTLDTEFKVPQKPYIADRDGDIEPSKKWHIFHYETLDKAIELAKAWTNEKVCVILDECHNFNEIKSLRTERFLRLCALSKSKNIVWASGTPVKAMGFETIPLLKSIDPLFTPQAEAAFRKMFGKDSKRTLDILAHRLGLITHITPKTQFMETQPIYQTINVTMPGSDKYTLKYLAKVMADFIVERTAFYKKNYATYRETYDKCIDIHRKTLKTPEQIETFKRYQAAVKKMSTNGFDARHDADIAVFSNKYEKEQIHNSIPQALRKPFIDAKSVVKYVELKVRGECLGRILTKERIQCHVDMVPHIDFLDIIKNIRKKTIVFTSYVKVVDACNAHLESLKLKPLIVYGENSGDLVGQVKKFATVESANPLVTTFQSLSTAVPLTMANGVIFLNNPWRSFEKDQAIARAHRIGQDEQVYGFDIVLDTGKEPNISSRSLDVMQWSKEQVDAIMGTASASNVSLESNGFVTSSMEDINEVLDDVKWSSDIVTDNYTCSQESVDTPEPAFVPPGRGFYNFKK